MNNSNTTPKPETPKVKLYDPVWYASMGGTYRGNNSDMQEYEDGDWVKLEDYQSLETKLRDVEEELQDLRAWKESAMEVEREWDSQAIAKLLGATLGQSCRKVVAKRVPEVLEELERLRARVIELEGRV